MSHRIITDHLGARWQVWSVVPSVSMGAPSLAISPEYLHGWLAFEREGATGGAPREKRRLAPVPADWERAPEPEVLALLAAAVPVETRLHPRAR